ncbi:sugar transferase [Rhodobacter sp. ETT8]|uniref:Sugar transferase n=1 Tax=Pseudotabrizicola algicola TaxID=2709381 RepID=A0A6B3RMZ9_9RHOB|nr:sugar transferase [Pseudotabrizicola algicola]
MSFTFPEFPPRRAQPVKPPPDFSGLVLRPKTKPFGLYRNVFKRVLDLTALTLAAPVVVPVIAVLALGVALDGSNPFYSQLRIGKGGKEFRMWKLRSMVRNADAQLQDVLKRDPAARAEWAATQKLRNDPRITRFGKLLRRSSLDELPQLWNVLTGDMSLVGPRPMMVDQRDIYPGTAYYNLRPGITGYWQTAGRNRTTFQARAEYDTVYDEGLAFTTDMRILWRTISVVMNGTGC